uniref:HAT C-terminal dimerisation domain-containing protein n=1 Tax=Amphimedon queenslandica TaxID=400682 RepID=A0A1X7TYX7_AMPQE
MKSRATPGVINRNGPDFEVSSYLASPCLPEEDDVLEFWKSNEATYPTLAKIASTYLAFPASSAAVERIFSIAGKIFRPERCSLSDKLFKDLMFVRCNENIQH